MADEVKVGEIAVASPVTQKTTEEVKVKKDVKKKSKSREELSMALVDEQPEVKTELVAKEEKKLEEPKKDGDDFKVKVTSLETELKSKTDRLESMQRVLDKLGTEVGLLRKKTPEQIKELKQKARDLILEEKDDEALLILKGIEETESKQKETVDNNEATRINRENIIKLVPDFEKSVPEILEIMKEDGTSEESLTKIKENPFLVPFPLTYNISKRAELRKQNVALKSELEKLKVEVEELKKKPDAMLRNIANAANRNSIDGKAGASSEGGNGKLYEINPRRMSKKALEQALYDET